MSGMTGSTPDSPPLPRARPGRSLGRFCLGLLGLWLLGGVMHGASAATPPPVTFADIVDVRLKRADLPEENNQAIYRRMQTEREREAKELRAQGAELAQRIRARADRERRVIIAEAEKESQITRGEGDADAVRIFADAFGKDVEFFTFYRTMQAYRGALGDANTSFVLSPDSEFFRFFDNFTVALPTGEGTGDTATDGETQASGAPGASEGEAAAIIEQPQPAAGTTRIE